MADGSIRIEGLEELLAKVDRIQQMTDVPPVLMQAGVDLKARLAIYPPQKSLTRESVYGTPFKTDKQRRFFFAALRKGTIDVPYRRGQSARSEDFAARWIIRAENGGWRVVSGNNTSYGPLLMDDDRQSLYAAASGWRTVGAVAAEEAENISEYVVYALKKRWGVE